MNEQEARQINAIQTSFLREYGKRLVKFDKLEKSLVAAEGIVTGMVLLFSDLSGINPLVILAILFEGVTERIKDIGGEPEKDKLN